MIQVSEEILRHTLELLLRCGRGRNECVVLWTGVSGQDAINEAVHPSHVASPGSYEVDPEWLSAFWFELGRKRQSIQAQLHTHPGAAFHSLTDDRGAIGGHRGFVSIVIPYAARRRSLMDARAYEIGAQGWQEVALEEILTVTR